MGEEKRQHRRMRLPMEMRWEGMSGRHVARVYDLSLSGCYVETLGHVTRGERIEFEIQIPSGRWLRLQGVVMHTQPGMGFGLRLLDETGPTRELLERLLEFACVVEP